MRSWLRSLVTIAALAAPIVAETFTNPVIWEELADNEVHRVGDTYYLTASTMHYSPGAPILRSKDLVNWEYVSHSVPVLDWNSQYDLADGKNAYVKGIWASSLRHRASNGLWYFVACVEFSKTYLSADGLSETQRETVFQTPSDIGALEGARMYKRDGNYYIFLTRPPDGQYVLKSSSPWGPYEVKVLADRIALSSVPNTGSPHQGSLVDTQNGDWYYVGFTDIYPGGRSPVLAPITWGDDGFPSLVTVNGAWGDYEYPRPRVDVPSALRTDEFSGTSLRPEWEWNHNPDVSGFEVNNGPTLRTVTVASDLYSAHNTLTHRIRGPIGTGTVHLNVASMADGDRVGLAALRDKSSWIGIEREGDVYSIVTVGGLTMNTDWTTNSTGAVVERRPLADARDVYLRMVADIRPGGPGNVVFSYSVDGQNFETVGASFTLYNNWEFFLALGGSVRVSSFTNA
ncbi:family 43 glycosyl hydrolase [Colletotrichum phormii]|uniref:Family 43 glycosyl hydrolase n=1 Tax=Colletotrichum phormii TaxID=359342 RepID=A0AAJ0EBT9_9PEZI|nr:family 43 glycosyl hydrolase [Colletotrichum phormii]KAK1625455.1 family 43 glycosyl hydrolase [Colletotrichum phormii]